MNAHDLLEQRMQVHAGSQLAALDVVDRVLATEDEQEEQLRESAAEPDDPAATELLEHQRVLRLLDDLVVCVPELRRPVGQRRGELQQAALEYPLEDQADLHLAGHKFAAQPCPHGSWQLPV